MLTQHEEMKLKELEEECARILRTHKASIPPKLEVNITLSISYLIVHFALGLSIATQKNTSSRILTFPRLSKTF